mgnify:CR=1 FL=1|tara:strand:- start:264 stop:503 length:240 start_codon:yes stop_codon:yes gene_type:complete
MTTKTTTFGSSETEDNLKDMIKAREIVQSVLEYGVNQTQIIQIIKLFALELENVSLMKDLTTTINQSREGTKSNIITGE